jgi:hypothetical protein
MKSNKAHGICEPGSIQGRVFSLNHFNIPTRIPCTPEHRALAPDSLVHPLGGKPPVLCIEIALAWFLGKQIAANCKVKGRQAAGWVLLFIFLWIAGEVVGGVVGLVLTGGQITFVLSVCGIIGGLVGAAIAFFIVNNLSASPTDDEFYRTDYAEPRRRLPDQSYGDKFGNFRDRERKPDWDGSKGDEDPGLYRPEDKP